MQIDINLHFKIIFMKIAHVVCTFPPYKGGMGNSVYCFAKALAKLGHEISVFTPYYSNGDFENIFSAEESEKIKIFRLKPLFKYGNGAFLPQLLWKLNGFDIAHLHYPFYGSAEIVLLKKILSGKKMKLAVHYHMDSMAVGLKGLIFKLYNIFVLPLIARAAEIITCASFDYINHSALAGYYNKNKKKFRQTFFGVDLDQFVVYRDHKNEERKEKVILFVGGLDKAHYFKGLENLLQAVSLLKKDFANGLKLNIIGEGDMKPYYKDLSKSLEIEKYVNFAEKIDDSKLVSYYNYCDVAVLPSVNKGEAFGLVLLEAMACAKPVVASNLPGVRSVFKKGRHGLLAKPNDAVDLANKLRTILNDKKLAREMGERGREFVENRYSWKKIGKKLDVIYHYVKYTPK